MKRIALILAVLMCATAVIAQDTQNYSFEVSKGQELYVDAETGAKITIEGWSKDEVVIEARAYYSDWDDYDVRVDKRSGRVVVDIQEDWRGRRNRRNRSRIELEIKVPEKFDLELHTMGGDISIEKVEGRMRGKTMGGDFLLNELKGRISLTTMGGDIEVTDSELDGEIKTMGGRVLVENVTGDLDASSMGGEVVQRNVTDGRGNNSGKEVRISTMGGPIRVDDAMSGADLHTMGGDIRVRNAGKHVKVKTMGGDIEIQRLDGSVDGVTMGGDIEVRVVGESASGGKDIELESMSGDIEVVLPVDFSMDIEVEIEYTKRSRYPFRIESDFKMDIEESGDWERSRRGGGRGWRDRDMVKYIDGKGKFSGAKNKVTLSTVNGNIYIKKGN